MPFYYRIQNRILQSYFYDRFLIAESGFDSIIFLFSLPHKSCFSSGQVLFYSFSSTLRQVPVFSLERLILTAYFQPSGRPCFHLRAVLAFTFRHLTAFSTASTITPTSAKMAIHILAIPKAPKIRHNALTARANTMFS